MELEQIEIDLWSTLEDAVECLAETASQKEIDLLLSIDPENFRMPEALSAKTYAFAAVITISAALASALLVRRRLDKLDLIAVLKTRE